MKSIRIHSRRSALGISLAALCCAGCWDDDDETLFPSGGEADFAMAVVRGYTDTSIRGAIRFDESGDSLRITAAILGLQPNQAYAIHVHEMGNCSSPEASGGHFHQAEPHGSPVGPEGTHHRGDLPNVQVGMDSIGRLEFSTNAMDLESTEKSIINRSVVLHALPDDFITQPAGGSGDRIACGVIQFSGPGNVDTVGRGGRDTSTGDGTGGGTGGPYDRPLL